jgi:hypothetical protein
MRGDDALPVQTWDFAPWQAARLVSGAAQEAAHTWARHVPEAAILDVTWDLHETFRDLGTALQRLSQFRQEPESIDPGLHDPRIHIHLAGNAAGNAATVLRDREVLEHVRRSIAYGHPVGGDPRQADPAITAALELADAAAMAFRITGPSPAGTVLARDGTVGAFMRATDNLDAAVQNLAAHAPMEHSTRLGEVQADLEEAYSHLREALICSAVDFRQPGSGKQVVAMRERYPVLPHRLEIQHAARLADVSFPPNSVLEAVGRPPSHAPASGRPTKRNIVEVRGNTR